MWHCFIPISSGIKNQEDQGLTLYAWLDQISKRKLENSETNY
jgi:hypothetical protein